MEEGRRGREERGKNGKKGRQRNNQKRIRVYVGKMKIVVREEWICGTKGKSGGMQKGVME